MIKIGINGFGRIGRLVFRASLDHENVEVVGINDLITPDYMAYMLKYDTMHGRFDGTVDYTDHSLIVNGHEIRVTAEKNPADLKWSDVGAETSSSPPVCSSPRRRLRAISMPARSTSSCPPPPRTAPRCSSWA